MELLRLIYRKMFAVFRKANVVRLYNFSNDKRPNAPFKLVYFCGSKGIEYLNASLFSVYKTWEFLPELLVVTDGTPASLIQNKIIKWPRDIKIICYDECAEYFRNNGNPDLETYAKNDIWGKKFVTILYCSLHFPTLYSDTDILWFKSPFDIELRSKPMLIMCQDVEYCYSDTLLKDLSIKDLTSVPLNAGLIFANGNFTSFPKWKELCTYLANNYDNRSEQTSFAILNSFFSLNNFWPMDQVLIKVDDAFSLKYTYKAYPRIFARHYVNVKNTTFWRDLIYLYSKK